MIDRCRYALIPWLVMFAGCKQPVSSSPSGAASGNGWEVRYSAVLGLAHRGSDKFLDPVVQDLASEMLDEQQQLRNFRTVLKTGQEVMNEYAARSAILGTLNSVRDYHEKKPTADLAALRPAIEKLTRSENKVLAKESKTLLDSLAQSPK